MSETQAVYQVAVPEPEAEAPTPAPARVAEPSQRIAASLQGQELLDFVLLSNRILFVEKLSPARKEEAIIKLALKRLQADLERLSRETGSPFVPAERL